MLSTKHCMICKRPNETINWHRDTDTGDLWCWCQGTCQRGYSLYNYCDKAGISLPEFLKLDFTFEEAPSNEVNSLEFPQSYIPLHNPKAKEGLDYIISRGLDPKGDIYYDMNKNGIVFPYYFGSTFVGAQTRLIKPKGDHKIDTIPGTRLGLLFYGWNQGIFVTNIKGVIVTEGAFNALSIQQALDNAYGGVLKNPFKCIAASGSGASKHQLERMIELKNEGLKIIVAPDKDPAGLKMLEKYAKAGAATHYALPLEELTDWNDLRKEFGKEIFAQLFLKLITPLDVS